MGLFRHPHLIRGIVHTANGAFVVSRGVVDMADEFGEALGWPRADRALDARPDASRPSSSEDVVSERQHASRQAA